MEEKEFPEYCYDNRTHEPISYSRNYSEEMVESIRREDYTGIVSNYKKFKNHIKNLQEQGIEYNRNLEYLTDKIYLEFVENLRD